MSNVREQYSDKPETHIYQMLLNVKETNNAKNYDVNIDELIVTSSKRPPNGSLITRTLSKMTQKMFRKGRIYAIQKDIPATYCFFSNKHISKRWLAGKRV